MPAGTPFEQGTIMSVPFQEATNLTSTREIKVPNFIKETPRTARRSAEFFTVDSMSEIEVKIPGSVFSLKFLPRYIKEFFGYLAMHIVCEATLHGDRDCMDLTTRVIGKPAKKENNVVLTNLDQTLLEAAKHIYKHTDPFTLASYYYSNNHQDESLEIMQKYCLYNEPPKDDHLAYNLRGMILNDRGKYDEAIEKYNKAIEIDPQSVLTHYYLGVVYKTRGQRNEAIKSFQHVLELAPNTTLANDAKNSITELTQKDK